MDAPKLTIKGMAAVQAPSVKPSATLLIGPSGSGKTSSLLTYAVRGIKTRIMVTEGNGTEVILDAMRRLKKQHREFDDRLVHWHAVTPTPLDIDTLLRKAQLSNRMGASQLQGLEGPALERDRYPQYMQMIRACGNFTSDRNGEDLGNIAHWGDDTAFAVDSLTGLNQMVTQHTCGLRPTMTQPEFGICQSNLRDVLTLWTSLRCFFVLTAHVEREVNDVTGETKVMASTIGKALAPDLPAMFSDVVLSAAKGEGFVWATKDTKTDLKYRNLPRSDTIRPDFGQMVDAYHTRLKEAKLEEVPVTEAAV